MSEYWILSVVMHPKMSCCLWLFVKDTFSVYGMGGRGIDVEDKISIVYGVVEWLVFVVESCME